MHYNITFITKSELFIISRRYFMAHKSIYSSASEPKAWLNSPFLHIV